MSTFRNWNEDWQQPSKGVGLKGGCSSSGETEEEIFGNQADIQKEAVLNTLSQVPEEKGTESILPYCYQQAL